MVPVMTAQHQLKLQAFSYRRESRVEVIVCTKGSSSGVTAAAAAAASAASGHRQAPPGTRLAGMAAHSGPAACASASMQPQASASASVETCKGSAQPNTSKQVQTQDPVVQPCGSTGNGDAPAVVVHQTDCDMDLNGEGRGAERSARMLRDVETCQWDSLEQHLICCLI